MWHRNSTPYGPGWDRIGADTPCRPGWTSYGPGWDRIGADTPCRPGWTSYRPGWTGIGADLALQQAQRQGTQRLARAESSRRLTDAEEPIRELKAQVEELKLGRYKAQRASEEEKSASYAREQKVLAAERELEESPALRCQKALARLLERMTHQDLKDPPLEGAKRRGSWSTTLRAACGRFLALMHELTDEALAGRAE